MPTARTNPLLRGKEILMLIEKTSGAGTFTPYACITAANFTNPGVTLESIACRAGTYKEPTDDPELPTIALESIYRIPPTADVANNVSDSEIYDYVVSGEKKNIKLIFGSKTGDMVLTGPGTFTQQTINGPQSGLATGGVTFSFSEQPTKTASL